MQETANSELKRTRVDRLPHNTDDYIISRAMMKHILGQSMFQLALLLILVFTGDSWIPEYLEYDPMPNSPGDLKYYSNSGHVRSGRAYMVSETGEDYKRFETELGPSRHFTFIFNFFVFCKIFNRRRLHTRRPKLGSTLTVGSVRIKFTAWK